MTDQHHQHENADGTTVPWDGEHDGVRQIIPPGQNEGLSPRLFVDDLTALQVGMADILTSLTFTTIDRKALLEDRRVEANEMRVERVFLDWPDTEDDQVPVPSATVMAPDAQDIELAGPLSGRQLLEDTVGVYGEGTVLRHLGEVSTTIQVVFWVAHKDERAAVRREMINAFIAEPDDERGGRRVTVPEYFDRVARFSLRDVAYQDNPTDARQKIWPLVARFDADIQLVKLVQAPATLLVPRIDVQAT